MTDDEQAPSIITRIENAATPVEAVQAIGQLSLRRMVMAPINVGRDILKIVMRGDAGEMLGSVANHQ